MKTVFLLCFFAVSAFAYFLERSHQGTSKEEPNQSIKKPSLKSLSLKEVPLKYKAPRPKIVFNEYDFKHPPLKRESRVILYGACRAPSSVLIQANDPEYADCMNSESYGKYGSYKNSSKFLGIYIPIQ